MRFVVAVLLVLSAVSADVTAASAARADAQSAPTPQPVRQPSASIVAEPAALLIAACDADGDARTTAAELDACLARGFGGAPSLGYIDYADWSLKWLGDRAALPSPFTVDTNGDNRITLAELRAQFASLFARFDADKDGAATRAELLTIRGNTGGDEGRRGRTGRR